MLPGRRNLAAVVIGAVLAGGPVLFVQHVVDRHIEQQGQAEVETTARRGIALAESRIKRVAAGLSALSGHGIDGCSAADRAALSAAAFDLATVKELAVVDAAGETLCTDHGLPLGQRRVVSSIATRSAANLLVEVIALDDRRDRFVRIRRTGRNGNGLAALVPAELMLPQTASDGGSLRPYTVVLTRDGTVIGESGTPSGDGEVEAERITTLLKSKDFGLTVNSAMSRAGAVAARSDIRGFGLAAAGCILVVIGWTFLFVRLRQRDNPIAEMRRALHNGEFVPYFQPILDIGNGRLEGAEVLIRWRKPDGTVIPPARFIPVLESSGLIFDVTRALMHRVCREAGAAIGRRARCRVSFNLTARHFADDTIVSEIRDIFAGSPIALSQVVLEVTERQPLENLTAARSVIAALQELGVRVAIDDVGTGHGGLSYLLKLGVDIIKIDKLFVDAIGAERHSAVIIDSLVELSRRMRMDIVAEGVESFEQVAHLRDRGIGLAQGYVFAPPLPVSSFLQLLEAADPLPAAGSGAAEPAPHYISARNRVTMA